MIQEKVILILPAFNEEKTIMTAVTLGSSLIKKGVIQDFVVIDDGSTDHTANLAKQGGAKVISLPKNMGKGSAFLEGALYCKRNDGNILLIIDADLVEAPEKLVISMLDKLRANDGGNNPYKMVIAPYSEGEGKPQHNYSGERAIRMDALNFLFVKRLDNCVFSDSKPSKRFIKMSKGYGLEPALDWQIKPSVRLGYDEGAFKLVDTYHNKGARFQKFDLHKTYRQIENREEHCTNLRTARILKTNRMLYLSRFC